MNRSDTVRLIYSLLSQVAGMHAHISETKTWAGGSDNTWVLSHTPRGGQTGGMVLTLNSLVLVPGVDYLVADETITMAVAPEADDVSFVSYLY